MGKIKNFFASGTGRIFVAAIFLRLFLAPFFFHPDNKTIFYNSHFLSERIINIYEFLGQNPAKANLGNFPYPWLTYLVCGVYYLPLKFILGSGFTRWLSMGNDAVAIPEIFRYLFAMKLPLILFESLIGVLLMKLIADEDKRERALLFWFFNPANLYAVVFMGQFDIIPAFLTVLALYLTIVRKKTGWGAIALGIGGALKTYPLLFLPFLVLLATKNWRQRLKLAILGLIPYGLFVFPFLGNVYFRQSSFVSGLSQRMFLLNLSIGFEEQILLVLLGLVFLVFLADWRAGKQNLTSYFLTIPLIILAGSHFHPQWLLWAMPFLALLVGKEKRLFLPAIILLAGWLGVVLLFDDKFLTWGLVSPFDPGVFFLPPSRELVQGVFSPALLQSICHTLFSAAAVWISVLVLSGKQDEKA